MTCQNSSRIQPQLAAIVLAAGYSSRMGSMKALLPVKEEPFLLRQIRLLQEAGVRRIVVVTGHDADQIHSLLEVETDPQRVKIIWNAAYHRGMFSSIQAGANEIDEWPVDGFFLLPGDQPLRDSSTLQELALVFDSCRSSLVVPCFRGKKGHPPVIPIAMIENILSCQEDDGMKRMLQRSGIPVVPLETEDPFTVMEMNTPEEYLRFLWELDQLQNLK